MSYVDQYTEIDNEIRRTNQLLASLVEANGAIELPENTDPTPYGAITVPDGRPYAATVPGKTTIDFADGHVKNEHVGKVIEEIDTIRDLSRSLDSSTNNLRSLFIYVDAPAQLKFDGQNTQTLEAGNYYEFVDSGFTEVTLRSDTTVAFTLAASTRREAVTVDGEAGFSSRKANRRVATFDTWQRPNFVTDYIFDSFSSTDYPETHEWYVRPFGNKLMQMHNGSPNEAEVRVLACDLPNPEDTGSDDPNTWYELERITLGSDERHKFVIDEPHHSLSYEFRNTTNGEDVTVGATCIGSTN